MQNTSTIIIALTVMLATANASAADAIMGGTAIWRHESRSAWIMYLDWFYISTDADHSGNPSIALYDKDSADKPVIGVPEAQPVVVDGNVFYRIVSGECTLEVDLGDTKGSVKVQGSKECDIYRTLEGNYYVVWTPPE